MMAGLFAVSNSSMLSKLSMKKLVHIVFLVMVLTINCFAQSKNGNSRGIEKIRGARFMPCPNYTGKPYLFDKFLSGNIKLTDGTVVQDLALSYCTFRDELVYYNSTVSAQVMVDKISLEGFDITDPSGHNREFIRLDCEEILHGQAYFEILSRGKRQVLAYRKVNLEPVTTYYSKTGMAYEPGYRYFIYDPQKGFAPVNLSRNSLLSKFSKPDQKVAKKILRKSGLIIADERSFVRAWSLFSENGLDGKFIF